MFPALPDLFSFPQGTEMFHFPWYPTVPYVFRHGQRGIPHVRFPHSDIHGSKVAWDLPVTFRTLQRPSSVHTVKLSTIRPYYALPPHKEDERETVSRRGPVGAQSLCGTLHLIDARHLNCFDFQFDCNDRFRCGQNFHVHQR